MLAADQQQLIHVTSLSIKMDSHYCLGLRRNFSPHARGINLPCILKRVSEYWRSARLDDGIDRGYIGQRWDNNFIPRANTNSLKG